MSDDCTVYFTRAAAREMGRVADADPRRAVILRQVIGRIEENGWILSQHAELVRVLRAATCVGEIRDVGRGGYRLFFFWHVEDAARQLWICRVLPKREVEARARLAAVCDAVEAVRRRFYEEEGEP